MYIPDMPYIVKTNNMTEKMYFKFVTLISLLYEQFTLKISENAERM